MIEIREVDPADELAQWCLREYFDELDRRFETGFDLSQSLPTDHAQMRPPAGTFVIATLRGEAAGCGALRLHGDRTAELKRMWVSPTIRGAGVGRRLLEHLERTAVASGSTSIRLDTNGSLVEAIAMYRSAGYLEIAAYNEERYADHWFEKKLRPAAGTTTDLGT
jgi:ribosomal protein S18 acetylase RimI-like enzyme